MTVPLVPLIYTIVTTLLIMAAIFWFERYRPDTDWDARVMSCILLILWPGILFLVGAVAPIAIPAFLITRLAKYMRLKSERQDKAVNLLRGK